MKSCGLKKKGSKKPHRNVKKTAKAYSTYIYRFQKEGDSAVSKLITLPRSISAETVVQLGSEAARLSRYNKRRTITRKEIRAALQLLTSAKP